MNKFPSLPLQELKKRHQFDTTIKLCSRSILPHRLGGGEGENHCEHTHALTFVILCRSTRFIPIQAVSPAPAALTANQRAAGRATGARCGLCLSDRGSGVNTGALIHQPFVMASARLASASWRTILREKPRFIPLEGKKNTREKSVRAEHGCVLPRVRLLVTNGRTTWQMEELELLCDEECPPGEKKKKRNENAFLSNMRRTFEGSCFVSLSVAPADDYWFRKFWTMVWLPENISNICFTGIYSVTLPTVARRLKIHFFTNGFKARTTVHTRESQSMRIDIFLEVLAYLYASTHVCINRR